MILRYSQRFGEKYLHNKQIDGYSLIEINTQKHAGVKKGRKSGGFLIYIKKQFCKSIKLLKSTPFYVWLDIDKKHFPQPERKCALYIPPISSSYHDKDVFNELALDLIDFSSARNPTILMGDFNARIGCSDIRFYIDFAH